MQVYEVGTFAVTATLRYEGAPLLALAAAPDNSRLVVGSADGTLQIRQRFVKVSLNTVISHSCTR
jgi:3'-phosphoadenosine 5'-phosphosulfate (PAPS) 3'-phosphatase